jgi:hypothetical protein
VTVRIRIRNPFRPDPVAAFLLPTELSSDAVSVVPARNSCAGIMKRGQICSAVELVCGSRSGSQQETIMEFLVTQEDRGGS